MGRTGASPVQLGVRAQWNLRKQEVSKHAALLSTNHENVLTPPPSPLIFRPCGRQSPSSCSRFSFWRTYLPSPKCLTVMTDSLHPKSQKSFGPPTPPPPDSKENLPLGPSK